MSKTHETIENKDISDSIETENTVAKLQHEVEQRPHLEELTIEEITYKRRKSAKRGLNRDAFKDLPVEIETYELPEEDLVCDCCKGALHSIGTQSKSTLEFVPARLFIKEVLRHKYACRNCQAKEDTDAY